MSQQTNDPNSNLQRRAHRTTNQRIWNIENQFLTGGVSLKDIARGVVINSQMIDNLRQNPGVTQEQKVTYKRQDNQQSNIQSEVIKLSALSDIDYYDDTGTQQTTGASVKVNRITTTTDTTGNLFVITNDGKVIMYNKRTNPAIVYDLTSNDVLTFRNDTNQVKLRFNRVDGKITASVLESSQCDIISGGYLNFLSGSTNYYRMYRDGTDLKLNSSTNGTIYTISNTGVITATNHINTSGNIVADGTITANGGFTTSTSMSTDGNITAQGFVQVGDDLRVSGNAGFGMTPTYKVDVNGSARISTALGIGTAPDGANPLKVEGNTLINGNLRVSSGTQMDGNVGIGGAADGSSTLRVVGDALIDGDSAGSANLKLKKNGQSEQSVVRMDNSGQIYIGSSVSGKHTFIDAGGSTSIMVDGSTNNVGIGGNPSYLMDVAGSGRVQTALGIATAPNGSIPLVVNGKTHLQSNTGIGVAPDSTHDLLVNGSTRLSGNVGVGTAATSNKFEVSGSGKFTQYIGVGGADPNASYPLHVTGNSKLNGRVGVNGDPDSTHALQVNGSANIYNSASGDAELWFKSGTETNKTIVMQNDGDVYFQSTDAETYLRGNSGIRFETDTGSGFAEHMIITQAGNVGIGTGYTPNYILDTKDNVRFGLSAANSQLAIGGGNNFKSIANNEAGIAQDDAAQYAIKQNSSGQTELNAVSGQAMIFNINDSQQMILDSSGNFGIGADTSLDEKLHISRGNIKIQEWESGGIGNNKYIYTSWEDVNNKHQIGMEFDYFANHATNHSRINFIANGVNNQHISGANTNTIMSIQSNGNVGIGITSPSSALHVYDSVEDGTTELRISNGDVDGIPGSQDDGGAIIFDGAFKSDTSYSSASAEYAKIIGAKESGSNYTDGYISFYTNRDQDRINGSSPLLSERMRINSLGYIGIGTTGPDEKLEVDSGNILIYPVATPTYTPSSVNYIRSHLLNSNESILDIIGNGQTLRLNSGNTPWIGTSTNHAFRLKTNGDERLYIDTSGNVGIGTSAITGGYKLDVNGSQVIRDNLYVQDEITFGNSTRTGTSLFIKDNTFTERIILTGTNNILLGATYSGDAGQGNVNTNTIIRSGGSVQLWTKNNVGTWTEGMRLTKDGYIGIGTSSPNYTFDVPNGNQHYKVDTYWQGYGGAATSFGLHLYQSGTGNTPFMQFGYRNYGTGQDALALKINSAGNLFLGSGTAITSDRRIKININDIDDNIALTQLRTIKPRSYNYKNNTLDDTKVIGYIAQEVADVIPEAVTKDKGEVPYYMDSAILTSDNILNFNTDVPEFNTDMELDFDGVPVEYGIQSIILAEKLSNRSFKVNIISENDYTNDGDISINVKGYKVDDFHYLKKEYIFTVATAALQELDRDHEATKAELATTKQELATANQKIDLLLQRMEALEQQVNSA